MGRFAPVSYCFKNPFAFNHSISIRSAMDEIDLVSAFAAFISADLVSVCNLIPIEGVFPMTTISNNVVDTE